MAVVAEHGVEAVSARLNHWMVRQKKWTAVMLARELSPTQVEWLQAQWLAVDLESYDVLLGSEVYRVG